MREEVLSRNLRRYHLLAKRSENNSSVLTKQALAHNACLTDLQTAYTEQRNKRTELNNNADSAADQFLQKTRRTDCPGYSLLRFVKFSQACQIGMAEHELVLEQLLRKQQETQHKLNQCLAQKALENQRSQIIRQQIRRNQSLRKTCNEGIQELDVEERVSLGIFQAK